ncbi:hypothetical protein BH11PLA2_BH11PLA2_04620 [soil metagenome]
MQKPATLTDAVEVVRKSRLVTEDRLVPYLDTATHVFAPLELFADMVRQGLLTTFQATQLENGRWKGFEIGSYRVLDRLGQGGMGQVFLAEHITLGKRVAIKVLSRTRNSTPLAMERFIREARAAAKLDHPNIVHVYDISTAFDPPYIVMEYVDGITLQAAVSRHGTLAPGNTAWVGRQIALGLDEAYRHGLVHRDVKPANILVDRRGAAKLLDLGIVRIDGEAITSEYAKNIILGTLDYLSPEQSLDSSNVDTRADIYSLGATLYFLLVGCPPLPTGGVKQRLHQLQSVDPPHIGTLRPEIPPCLADVIHKMLAKNPAERFQTPAETADALAPFAVIVPPFPASLFRSHRVTLSDTDQGAVTPPTGIETSHSQGTTEFTPPVALFTVGELSLETQLALSTAQVAEVEQIRKESRTEMYAALKAQRRKHAWYGFALIGVLALAFVGWAVLRK